MVSYIITIVAVVFCVLNADAALVSYKEFRKAVVFSEPIKVPAPSSEQYEAFIRQLPNGNITSKTEAAMFLSQVLFQTWGLRHKNECPLNLVNGTWVYGYSHADCPGKYDRIDGAPGKYYYGRGYLWMKHSYNYKYASLDLYKDLRLINDPDLVINNEDAAWGTAFWFWKAYVHNRVLVQKGFLGDATLVIFPNSCLGGNSGFLVFNIFKKILKAFNIKGRPDERGC